MRALITGIDGFVGGYLVEHLKQKGCQVYGTTILEEYVLSDVEIFPMDLLNKKQVDNVIKHIKPDQIYHLAGQSAVGASWDNPTLTMSINVNGTLNLLDAVRVYSKESKVLIVGSSDEYGPVKPEDCPIKEEQPLNPVSPYGISKVTQEQIAKLYSMVYDMQIIMVRPFNHIGPKQGLNFVVSDFASKIAEIEKGAQPIIKVGNLEAYRDFTDVRDIVNGYYLLMEKGHVGEIYNIGSNKPIKIRDILDQLINLSTHNIEIILDETRFRPADVPLVQCDNSKIKNHTGWDMVNNIQQTLEDTLNYWRSI